MNEPQADHDWVRDWLPDRFADVQFRGRVPAVKWAFFNQLVRPLADDAAEALWAALFVGVGKPFHFERAGGWMKRVFRKVTGPPELDAGQTVADGLHAALGWEPETRVFLVYDPVQVFCASWSAVLDCLRREWVPLGTLVMCCDTSPRAAVFWENFGPYYADRGKRHLVWPGTS
ncbi:MAG TPA: hypothetical protein VGE74_22380 [Gemmata sp.]